MTNADSALDELAALSSAQGRELLAALRDRLGAARLRVLVAGEAKRGKSTLVNALLPAGVTPVTAVATTVRYGDDPHAEVRFADGREEKQPVLALPDLVTERGNPGNRRRIAAVTVPRVPRGLHPGKARRGAGRAADERGRRPARSASGAGTASSRREDAARCPRAA
jgi:hypothetical protein